MPSFKRNPIVAGILAATLFASAGTSQSAEWDTLNEMAAIQYGSDSAFTVSFPPESLCEAAIVAVLDPNLTEADKVSLTIDHSITFSATSDQFDKSEHGIAIQVTEFAVISMRRGTTMTLTADTMKGSQTISLRGSAKAFDDAAKYCFEHLRPIPNTTRVLPTEERTVVANFVEQSGAILVPGIINGSLKKNFLVDSGAAVVLIPNDVFEAMVRTGLVRKEQILEPKEYQQADGKRVVFPRVFLDSIAVGDHTVRNIEAAIIPENSTTTMILGQSFLQRFPRWTIDNSKNLLILGN